MITFQYWRKIYLPIYLPIYQSPSIHSSRKLQFKLSFLSQFWIEDIRCLTMTSIYLMFYFWSRKDQWSKCRYSTYRKRLVYVIEQLVITEQKIITIEQNIMTLTIDFLSISISLLLSLSFIFSTSKKEKQIKQLWKIYCHRWSKEERDLIIWFDLYVSISFLHETEQQPNFHLKFKDSIFLFVSVSLNKCWALNEEERDSEKE